MVATSKMPATPTVLPIAQRHRRRMQADVVAMLKRRGYKRVALLNPDGMPWAFVEAVKGALAGGGEVSKALRRRGSSTPSSWSNSQCGKARACT